MKSPIKKLLVSINQSNSGYLIYFYFKIFDRTKEANTRFLFYKQHFYKQCQAEIGKSQAKAKQQPETKLLLLENYSLSSSALSYKNNRRYSKKCTKNMCVCFNEVILLMTLKMRLKMKNRSHRYDINRPRPRHGDKIGKYVFQYNDDDMY